MEKHEYLYQLGERLNSFMSPMGWEVGYGKKSNKLAFIIPKKAMFPDTDFIFRYIKHCLKVLDLDFVDKTQLDFFQEGKKPISIVMYPEDYKGPIEKYVKWEE